MPRRVIWASVAFGMPDRDIWVLRAFDGIDEHSRDELRRRPSEDAYKELVPALQCVARPNFRWKVERERGENEAMKLGFLLVRQETQLAVLETARRAICIVQTIVFHKQFLCTSVSYSKRRVSK